MSDCIWSSNHFNTDHQTQTLVRVYTPEVTEQFPIDSLRLTHQALVAALADVLDAMADLIPPPAREGVSQPLQSFDAASASATPHRGAETPLKAPAGSGMTSSGSRAGSGSEEAQAACLPDSSATKAKGYRH